MDIYNSDMDYKVENIIDNDDRVLLIGMYNSLKPRPANQDYNLFDVDKRLIPGDMFAKGPFLKLKEYAGLEVYSHYFVMYHEGSYTRMHTDNDDAIGLTIVTLVDTVDLVGGETLALVPAKMPEEKKGYQKGNDHKGRVIPRVIRMNEGDSVIYDRSLMHGVSEIEKGKRLVLVSWFRR